MQTVAFLNQKGGVGKSSCTHHLGGSLAALGRRVLLVDADPQSSLTQGLLGSEGLEAFATARTIAAILNGDDPFPEDVIHPSGVQGIDLIPGSGSLHDHVSAQPWTLDCPVQSRLADFLRDVSTRYDVCLIDCQPTFYSPSWSALVAADALVVPLQPEDYGAQGVRAVMRTFETVRRSMNPRLRLGGYLISMYNSRLAIHKTYVDVLRERYGRDVFETVIPIATDFKEAISNRLPVNLYKPKGASAKVMKALALELLDRTIASQGSEGEAA